MNDWQAAPSGENGFARQCNVRSAEPVGRTATPHLVLGPFYPIEKPPGSGADLMERWDQLVDVRLQRITVAGRVINRNGHPVVGALVEIWHADAEGRYRHPSDLNGGLVDPGFLGYGGHKTDENGRYCFKTVKPGAYRNQGQLRAPHIHFQVTGKIDRLVTQMFFPLEPLNSVDRPFTGSPHPELLVGSTASSYANACDSVRTLKWDIVLPQG